MLLPLILLTLFSTIGSAGAGTCPPSVDGDNDGVPDLLDNCPTIYNPSQSPGSGPRGSLCDSNSDVDGDGIVERLDNCPNELLVENGSGGFLPGPCPGGGTACTNNPNQKDVDHDGIGDICDPFVADIDADDVVDACDNCPTIYNPSQATSLGPGQRGSLCDSNSDIDGDGIAERLDNCPNEQLVENGSGGFRPGPCLGGGLACTYNPSQQDLDHDGVGDICDPCFSVPGFVDTIQIDHNPTTDTASLTWAPPVNPGGAAPLAYDIFKGEVSATGTDIFSGNVFAGGACFADDVAGTSRAETTMPTVGHASLYMVAWEDVCGTGPAHIHRLSVRPSVSNRANQLVSAAVTCP